MLKLNQKSVFFLILPLCSFFLTQSEILITFSLLSFSLILDFFVLKKKFPLILYVSLFVFFYSLKLYNDTFYVMHSLRYRYFIVSLVIFLYLLLLIIEKKKYYFVLNTFFFWFSLGSVFISEKKIEKDFNSSFISEKKYNNPFYKIDKRNDPVVLIILDELSSYKELFKNTYNPEDNINNSMYVQNGFSIVDDFTSHSISTKFSLPSILNFNLHSHSKRLRKIDSTKVGWKTIKEFDFLFKNNLLFDSLSKKNITLNSFSLIKINNSLNRNLLYPWEPRNSFKRVYKIVDFSDKINLVLNQTILKIIHQKYVTLKHDSSLYSDYNIQVLNHLSKTNFESQNFYYFHLLAPHHPFYIEGKFGDNLSKKLTLSDYLDYRRAVLNMVLNIVKNKGENVRFIISGDHGFRSFRNEVNPYSTTLYLKGYDSLLVKNNFSVQDLGYLINESF